MMNLSRRVAWPRAQAISRGSGSCRLNEMSTDSMVASSAARANATQPSRAGCATGDPLLVWSTR